MDDPNEIWNRACSGERVLNVAGTSAGDRALTNMLTYHGTAMNGGLLHAIECCATAAELDAAVDGYRYFELIDVADLINELAARSSLDGLPFENEEALEQEADRRHAELIPDDAALIAAFEEKHRRRPTDFSLVTAEDVLANEEIERSMAEIVEAVNLKRPGAL